MRFDVLTIFPGFFTGFLEHGIVRRAQADGLASINIHDLRKFTHDRHRTVDDRPFGGGEGMLLKPQPIFDAVESVWPERGPKQKVILLSPQGRRFTQSVARELGSRNITVNALAPGFIETDMTAGLSAELRTELLEKIPLKSLGQPEDIASVITYLCSDDAGFITGQTI